MCEHSKDCVYYKAHGMDCDTWKGPPCPHYTNKTGPETEKCNVAFAQKHSKRGERSSEGIVDTRLDLQNGQIHITSAGVREVVIPPADIKANTVYWIAACRDVLTITTTRSFNAGHNVIGIAVTDENGQWAECRNL